MSATAADHQVLAAGAKRGLATAEHRRCQHSSLGWWPVCLIFVVILAFSLYSSGRFVFLVYLNGGNHSFDWSMNGWAFGFFWNFVFVGLHSLVFFSLLRLGYFSTSSIALYVFLFSFLYIFLFPRLASISSIHLVSSSP
jgi:hypothetical protein